MTDTLASWLLIAVAIEAVAIVLLIAFMRGRRDDCCMTLLPSEHHITTTRINDEPDGEDGPWAQGWEHRSGDFAARIRYLEELVAKLMDADMEENAQLRIAFGKYIAGYRPGDELWSREDQNALEQAAGGTHMHKMIVMPVKNEQRGFGDG